MTNEKLKIEIISLIRDSKDEWTGKDSEGHTMIYLGKIADTLIVAGLRFGENLTATFDHMALEREHELERRLGEAEYWKSVYDLALNIAFTGEERAYYCKKAEEALKKESKD